VRPFLMTRLLRPVLIPLVLSGLLVVGGPTSVSDAATPARGTLTASGAVVGKWQLSSCRAALVQGPQMVLMAFGPSKRYPAVFIQSNMYGPFGGKSNLATSKDYSVSFYSSPTIYWDSGWTLYQTGPRHVGTGTLSNTKNLTSGSMTTTMVRPGAASVKPVHLVVSWSHCPLTTSPVVPPGSSG
jgi:hypothetical protein